MYFDIKYYCSKSRKFITLVIFKNKKTERGLKLLIQFLEYRENTMFLKKEKKKKKKQEINVWYSIVN